MIYDKSIIGNYTCNKCGKVCKSENILFTSLDRIPNKFPTEDIHEDLETSFNLPNYFTIDPFTKSKIEILSMYANELSNRIINLYLKNKSTKTNIMDKIKLILDTKYSIKITRDRWIPLQSTDKDIILNYELLRKIYPDAAKYSIYINPTGKHFTQYADEVANYARIMERQQVVINYVTSNSNVQEELQKRFYCICKDCVEVKDYKSEIVKLQHELESQKRDNSKINELNDKLKEKEAEIHQLEEKVQNQVDIITQMNKDEESMDTKLEELRSEIQRLNNIKSEQGNLIIFKEAEIKNLEHKVECLEIAHLNYCPDCDELKNELKEKEAEIHQLEEKLQSHIDIITQMNQESESKDGEIASLQERIDRIKGIMSGFVKSSE